MKDIDWSKHDFHQHQDYYELRLPDSITYRVRFSMVDGRTIVTGDFGDWIFSREFHPASDGSVSEEYWCEKLVIANQYVKFSEFSAEETQKSLKYEMEAILGDRVEHYISDMNSIGTTDPLHLSEIDSKELEYYYKCYDNVHEESYEEISHNYPDHMDFEDVISCEEIVPSLKCVFSAFNEMCKRMAIVMNK
jgi:hypothetical protein